MKLEILLEQYEIVRLKPLTRGWSRDTKTILTDKNHKKYLLRVSDDSLFPKKKVQFSLLQELEREKLPASRPISFGMLDDGRCYILLSYLPGEDGELAVPKMTTEEAYALGRNAGQVLQKIHALPFENHGPSWWEKVREKAPKKIQALRASGLEIPMQERIIDYYRDHQSLMEHRPQVFCHSDFHLGNMIVDNGRIAVIDFDKCTFADPFDEFKPYCWNVQKSEWFESGLIDSYFNDKIPEDFFPILKYYTAESMISHIVWAKRFGDREIQTARDVNEQQMQWWDDFKLDIPTWYRSK